MPASPEVSTTIIAVVPHESDPNLHIVDSDGNYPSTEHPGGQTYETTFRTIGTDKLGMGALSVARRLASMEGPNDIMYEAKPKSGDPEPGSGYFWKGRD